MVRIEVTMVPMPVSHANANVNANVADLNSDGLPRRLLVCRRRSREPANAAHRYDSGNDKRRRSKAFFNKILLCGSLAVPTTDQNARLTFL